MSDRFWKGPIGVSASVIVLLMFVGLLASLMSSDASPAAKLSPSAGCWEVKVDGNDAGDRVIKAGLSGSPDKVQSQLLEAAKHDPSALVALYNMSPLVDEDLLTESDVASGECYTAVGKQAWYSVSAELGKAVKTSEEAPTNGCNTYVKDGKVEIHCEDILGDREATKIVWGDGSETWILHRCGNPVTKDHPRHRHHDDDDDDDDDNPPDRDRDCPSGTVPFEGRCVKRERSHDSDGAGGDESPMKQDVDEHPQGDTEDAPDEEPPPAHRDDSDDDDGDDDSSEEHGSSGNDGAEAEGESDEEHSDEETNKDNEPDDPFGD